MTNSSVAKLVCDVFLVNGRRDSVSVRSSRSSSFVFEASNAPMVPDFVNGQTIREPFIAPKNSDFFEVVKASVDRYGLGHILACVFGPVAVMSCLPMFPYFVLCLVVSSMLFAGASLFLYLRALQKNSNIHHVTTISGLCRRVRSLEHLVLLATACGTSMFFSGMYVCLATTNNTFLNRYCLLGCLLLILPGVFPTHDPKVDCKYDRNAGDCYVSYADRAYFFVPRDVSRMLHLSGIFGFAFVSLSVQIAVDGGMLAGVWLTLLGVFAYCMNLNKDEKQAGKHGTVTVAIEAAILFICVTLHVVRLFVSLKS